MSKIQKACINPELLIWARECCQMDVSYAASKIGCNQDRLENWEAGEDKPTIGQLRKIAKAYRINFASFFLPKAPEVFKLPVKDYRRHHGSVVSDVNPEISIDLRLQLDIRKIALELEEELGIPRERFAHKATLVESPSAVAKRIRKILGITFEKQKAFRVTRVAFNSWRDIISKQGVLVLQSTKISLAEMRGYSVFFDEKPLVVVNRKDAYAARTFSLLHEFCHLLLRSNGLCDMNSSIEVLPSGQNVEVFCNSVASKVLVPDELLFTYSQLKGVSAEGWTDEILSPIARDFGVSREVILRKLLDNNLTTRQFYIENRERYSQEAQNYKAKSSGGFVPPATDVISAKGKSYVGLVIDALSSNVITSGDASDFLGVKAKHFSKIEAALGNSV